MSAVPSAVPSAALARLVVRLLVRAAVTHVVLCPGSRSAPLAYALDAARTRPGAPRLEVRTDERAAAFTALGVGAAGGFAAVVTTSGTAAGNLMPAMMEAYHAGVPLLAITADRPPELRGTWANQTSELQARLFGPLPAVDLVDVDALADPAAAARALARVIARARGAGPVRPGPVQLNLGFTDPLVPVNSDPEDDEDVAQLGAEFCVPADGDGHADADGAPGPLVLPDAPRTVVVAGDRAGPGALAAARAHRWPLLAEPSSNARRGPEAIGAYRLLLEQPALAEPIERVVVFGRPTLSRPVTRLLARPEVDVVLVTPYPRWPQPGRRVTRAGAVSGPPGDPGWLQCWQRAGAAAQRAVDGVLDRCEASGELTGPGVARAVAARTTSAQLLVVAASNPVRDLDLVAPALPGLVLAGRGLAGIDGTLSTAIGAGLATGAQVRVLVGDLAFLHDLNGLLTGPAGRPPQVQVVVLNDDGGGIFALLEHGARAEAGVAERDTFERLFGTPHGADLAALCAGLRVPHRRATGRGELDAALAAPAAGIEVVQVPARRDSLRGLHARLRAAVGAAVLAVP